MFLSAATVVLVALSASPAPSGDRPEYRAIWVTRSEWPSQDPAECKARIVHVFDAIAAANMNTAVFQIRGEAQTLYPSAIEPWSELLGGKDPGFDPVAFAIEEARKRNIQFHAYINAMPLWSSRSAPPADKNHLWFAHGPDSPEPWVCMDENGRPSRQEYWYMSAGVPGVQEYVRKVVMEVVRRYDVDGIHLDRIRYPGANYIHDPVSERRFRERGNPNLRDRADWQREQLDKLINDMAAEIREVRPKCVFSCAAWGIYNRYHLPGYGDFSSGYHFYYQDTWNWVRLGAMDVLMPMIYWDIPDPKPNYDELLQDFVRGVGGEHVVGGQSVFSPDENAAEIRATREAGAAGAVLFSLRGAERREVLGRLKEMVYAKPAAVPALDRVANPKTGCILGTVKTDTGSPLQDAWVSLVSADARRGRRGGSRRHWTSGSDGRFAFLDVAPGAVKVRVQYVGAATVESAPVTVKAGGVSGLDVIVPGGDAAKNTAYVQILAPADNSETTEGTVHVLGRAAPGSRVRVNGKDVEVFSTGAFACDRIAVAPGKNVIRVEAVDAGGRTQSMELAVNRREPSPPAPVKDVRIIEPSEDVSLMPGDVLSIKVAGPPGGAGQVTCEGIAAKLPLAEQKDAAGNPSGVYAATTRVPAKPTSKPVPIRLSFKARGALLPVEVKSQAAVEVWDPSAVSVGEAKEDGVGVTFGLHSVRLGGPYLGRIPRGTRFEIVGRQRDSLKIALSRTLGGWVPARDVTRLPAGTPIPHNYFTDCSIDGDDQCDRLTIGLREKVVFAVASEVEPSNRLVLDLFNTHHATTWISHKSGARVIGPVTVEQVEDDRVRMTVPLRCRQNWGYWTELKGNTLTLFVRRPPAMAAAAPASPLKGLLFALEAGHGGTGDGAVGLMGTKEKDVNEAAVLALERVLHRRGADTVLVRLGDSSSSLQERVNLANEMKSDFYVAIHANAAGNSKGYLAVSGTSTYYRDEHCHRAAELVYRKLLGLNWREFGVVGNFSYYPLQNTRVPAILVEQAFMSNPYDEARLLDPAYQRQQAEAIAAGLEEFFAGARELPTPIASTQPATASAPSQ